MDTVLSKSTYKEIRRRCRNLQRPYITVSSIAGESFSVNVDVLQMVEVIH